MERRLAAILAADVVGYSRLMEATSGLWGCRRRWAIARMSGKSQVNRSIMPRNRSAKDVAGVKSHTQAGVLWTTRFA